ncbi:NADH-quinone oxidoreductase subunit A [Saccharomonospora xinjiangensis]|uniref:NADH-quinone oxidoreductase subunit n=1 Tax=Saccharomonospora xinjiangensis XJ-54 TaxID=882086 RepID=I0V8P7_9PSEU|nr:NADH-quinone oxidoreductase subunit A [Saccharomonospora xinjiangensis]EID56500.1 NADH:ubiquinone oxidoreductase subunit 3 (chain A) [Saccharomonospora xinjiangensis XJ-54]
MNAGSALTVLAVTLLLCASVYGIAFLTRLGPTTTNTYPFLSGHDPTEHAVSRYHVRWYPVAMIFLVFDMEMVFMYPWTLVVAEKGTPAVVEMFVFLGILMAGVGYAWREGALRWT